MRSPFLWRPLSSLTQHWSHPRTRLLRSAARQSLSLVEDMYRVSGGTLQSIVARCPERVAAVRACVPDSVSYKLMREREPGKAAVELGLQVTPRRGRHGTMRNTRQGAAGSAR